MRSRNRERSAFRKWRFLCIALLITTTFAGCGDSDVQHTVPVKALTADDLYTVIERISVRWMANESNGTSLRASMSADGRFVVFESAATNLVTDDTNGVTDVFVYDRQSGTVERVSIADDESEANGRSEQPSISADGRYVAFHSLASNLVTGNTGGREVYVRDRMTGETRWVSFGLGGTDSNQSARNPAISGDGNVVAFVSSASNLTADGGNGQVHIFVHIRATNQIERVSVANDGALADGGSFNAALSGDGNMVAFQSVASNLANDTLLHVDIFVRDRTAQEVKRVSVASDGSEANERSIAPSLSADGRYVAFLSSATNLIVGDTNGVDDVYVVDLTTPNSTHRVSVASDGIEATAVSGSSRISADGRYVAFSSDAVNLVANDTNGQGDAFLHDRTSGQTERVSVSSQGAEADQGSLVWGVSGDGRYVAFRSDATNLVSGDTNGVADIFIHDRTNRTTARASASCKMTEGNGRSSGSSASKDSRYIVFTSRASNLVDGDTNGVDDIYLYDRANGATKRISRDVDGGEANGASERGSITLDGRYIVFQSRASNLVLGDTNNRTDIFLHDRDSGTTSRISLSATGEEGNHDSKSPSISEDGRFITFQSGASNLVANDGNGTWDIFLFDRTIGSMQRIAITASGTEPNGGSFYPRLSLDGNAIAFASHASNLATSDTNGDRRDSFVFDLTTRNLEHLSTDTLIGAHQGAGAGPMSHSGRYVGFVANTITLTSPVVVTNRVAYVYDRISQQITDQIGGSAPYFTAMSAAISPDGERLAFTIPGINYDPDGLYDVDLYVYYRAAEEAAFVARHVGGYQSTVEGKHMIFTSFSPAVVPDDTNDVSDVFVALRGTGPDPYSGPKCGG